MEAIRSRREALLISDAARAARHRSEYTYQDGEGAEGERPKADRFGPHDMHHRRCKRGRLFDTAGRLFIVRGCLATGLIIVCFEQIGVAVDSVLSTQDRDPKRR